MFRCWNCSLSRFLLSTLRPICLLLALCTAVSGLSCPSPCNPPTTCSEIDTSNCQNGVVKDACECCDVCGRGMDEICGEGGTTFYGRCGPAFECVRSVPEPPPGYPFSPQELLEFPGQCKPKIATIPPSQTPEPSNDTDCGSSDPDDETMEHTCRPKCSIEFCSQRSSQRICSAQGMEFTKVGQRNGCQHTSCFACFILIKPPCEHLKCREPPNKRCLREFYSCILDHYFLGERSTRPHMMRINDPRRNFYPGKVICEVPEVS